MLLAIISDIHSNLEALQTVLKEIDALGAEEIYCLGDIVGYGPHPHECISVVESRCTAVVRGNHDSGAIGRLPLERFNNDGAKAIQFTRRQTHPHYLRYLARLPYVYVIDEITLVHSSPADPKKFPYVVHEKRVEQAFKAFKTDVCFIGHTHIPFLFEESPGGDQPPIEQEVASRLAASTADLIPALEVDLPDAPQPAEEPPQPIVETPGRKRKRIIMVGSVGQPRDGNPRAAFGLFDTATGEYYHRRVAYDIQKTADAMTRAGLPAGLAKRLFQGL